MADIPLRVFSCFFLSLGLLLPACSTSDDAPATLVSASGHHRLTVEVADTDEERRQGLMFRKQLPADHGMLFDVRGRGSPAMWMKNVLIPLDMIFLDELGGVVAIVTDTTPESTELIYPSVPFAAVLEMPAGSARGYGLKVGDRVKHALFEKENRLNAN